MTEFNEGDRVIKARVYSPFKYCAFGGDSDDVPLGTVGVIVSVGNGSKLRVNFNTGHSWMVDISELDPYRKTLKMVLEEL